MMCQPADTVLSYSTWLCHEKALLFLDLKSLSLVVSLHCSSVTHSGPRVTSLLPFHFGLFPSSFSLMVVKLPSQLVLPE